jgi:DNA-binding transcriptional MocR family regulator
MNQQSFLIISKEILADKRISVTAKLLLAQLIDHRNKQTGQCNPKRQTLARELGVSVPTIQRALSELIKVEFIRSKKRSRTNFYEFLSDQIDPAEPRVGSNRSGMSDQIDPAGPPVSFNELYIRGTTRAREASGNGAGSAKRAFAPPIKRKKTLGEQALELYYEQHPEQRKTGA